MYNYLQLRHEKKIKLMRETTNNVDTIRKQQLQRDASPECRALKVDRSRLPSRMMSMSQLRKKAPPSFRS